MKRLTKSQYEFLARQINGATIYHNEQNLNKTSFAYSLATNFAIEDREFDTKKFYEQCGLEAPEIEGAYPKVKIS